MQNSSNLPNGFVTVADAIKLIESDSRTDAKVDTAFLLKNLPYLRVDGNYNIKKLKHENGKVVEDGEVFVMVASEYERAMLEHAITEHYKNVTGRVVNPDQIGLRSITTAVDDEKNANGYLMNNDKPMIKAGEDIVSGVNQTVKE
jgi:hypothetical protein